MDMAVVTPPDSELKVYQPVLEVESLISVLVDNIYGDQNYQSYLTDLENSQEETNKRKARVIKKTCADIRVFNSNSDPLFLARDIGILTGVSNINSMIKNYTESEKVVGFILYKGALRQKNFLTRHGVYRTLFNSRTKLSEVFRGFIYKILDHMQTFELDKLKGIMQEYASENPDIVRASLLELHENAEEYKRMYEIEKREREMWENKAEDEHTKSIQLEMEKNEVEIDNNYNEMYIRQLRVDKEKAMKKVQTVKYDIECSNLMAVEELDTLKKKFLKEMTIYIAKPAYVEKLIKRASDKKTKKQGSENLIQEVAAFVDLDDEKEFLKEYDVYFGEEIDVMSQPIEFIEDLTMYYYISFKPHVDTPAMSDKFYYCCTQYIYDRTKFLELLEHLKRDVVYINTSSSNKVANNFLFRTSLEYIKTLIHDILTSNPTSNSTK